MSQSDSGPQDRHAQMEDEGYPDGMAWRCDVCDFATEDDEQRCPRHPEAYMKRVNRRITFGPLPSQSRDVVVEHR